MSVFFFKSKYITGLIIALLFITKTVSAQPYRPFPDSSAVWTIGVYNVFGTFYSHYTYRIASASVDTSISGLDYKKIFYFNSGSTSSSYLPLYQKKNKMLTRVCA
ncbi:MAG: hypothetical protein JWP12_3620 [Bacteroidetes bacterium]|nr:hypothetical protein [Bacteroidota bacterium]